LKYGNNEINPGYSWQSLDFAQVPLQRSLVYILQFCCSVIITPVLKVGADSGRHGWYKWSRGPVLEGDKTTQAVNIFDLLLLSVNSEPGTEEFHWRESRPCSEKVTRVLGIFASHLFSFLMMFLP
jgi:hypothetical protein